MEVLTLGLLRTCFREVLANGANFLRIARAAILKVIGDDVRKGGVIEVGTLSRRAMSSALLAIAEKPRLSLQKNEQLEVATKPAGVSPFSHWEISLYIGSGYEEMVLT